MSRVLREYGLPQPFAQFSLEHTLVGLIIRATGRVERSGDTSRGRVWILRVRTLMQMLQYIREHLDDASRRRMEVLLSSREFSCDDESPLRRVSSEKRQLSPERDKNGVPKTGQEWEQSGNRVGTKWEQESCSHFVAILTPLWGSCPHFLPI